MQRKTEPTLPIHGHIITPAAICVALLRLRNASAVAALMRRRHRQRFAVGGSDCGHGVWCGCVHAAVSVLHAWLMDGRPDQKRKNRRRANSPFFTFNLATTSIIIIILERVHGFLYTGSGRR